MTTLLDNKGQGKVGDALAEGIQPNARLSILSGLFSVYGYSSLKKQLAKAGVLRLLIPSNDPPSSENEHPFLVTGLVGSESDRRFRNSLNLVEIARECAQWLQQKAEVRAVSLPVSQNLFHIENPDGKAMAIHGSSPFTSAGLGAVPSEGYEMNTCFTTPAETESLLKWFNSIWSNPETTSDVKSAVVAQLETIFASKSPELVYFLTLYNVFRDYLGEFEEDKIIKTRTGIKDTLVWSKLYRFQRDGVLGAIDKIEKYNGCIIADSVGLGKTFEALAIIKYYELRNDRVLVLCPKKLRENWTIYTVNDRRNLFAADRFNYLQDCDYVVNYDIHWNPVRIIQRFGRIDRLGSRNQVIQLVNFWPNMELDEYINLEARVSGRMVLLDISATGEENIIEFPDAGKMNDLEYRRRQLEQLQNEVVDIEDLGGSISITDMTLNDFRMDLTEYLKEHADHLEHMPPGAFAVTQVDELIKEDGLEPGVIFCLRSETTKARTDSAYALAPYYLIWVSDSEEVQMNFTQAKKILDLFKKLSLGRFQPNDSVVSQFNSATHNGSDMKKYQALLAKAVAAITGKAEEKGVESLFQRGGTVLSKDLFQGIDDFEVVSYLIILGGTKND